METPSCWVWRRCSALGGDDAVRVRDAAPGDQGPGEIVDDDTREDERCAERPDERAADRGGGAAPAPGEAGRRAEAVEEEPGGEEEVDPLVGPAAVPEDGGEAGGAEEALEVGGGEEVEVLGLEPGEPEAAEDAAEAVLGV